MTSFTGQLGDWAANHADEIFKLGSIDALTAYVRVGFSNEDLEGMNLYFLNKLDLFYRSLHEYTQEFNSSYSYWKENGSVKADAYMYIGGLKVGAFRADLIINWQAGKYGSLLTLQNDVAKNSSWLSAAVNIPRSSNSATNQNRGKAHMPISSYKRPHGGISQSSHVSHNSFGCNGSKGASARKIN